MAAISPPSTAAVGSSPPPPLRAGLLPLRPSPMSRLRGGGGEGGAASSLSHPPHAGGGGTSGLGATGNGALGVLGRSEFSSPPSLHSSVGRLTIRPPPAVMDEEKLKKYKTAMCQRQRTVEGCSFGVHCDFAHSTEELRRSLNVVAYAPVMCQIRGCVDPLCTFSHCMYESQYHPDVYKTKICSHWDKEGGCPRGAYCSFAHGKGELRNKTRKFADASVADPLAPILPVRLSGDVRSDQGRFAHFRSAKSRVTVGGPVHRAEAANHPLVGGRGILDRERRFSAPERLIGEQAPSEADIANSSPAERARRRTIACQHSHSDKQMEQRLMTLLDDVSIAHQRKAQCLSDPQQEALSLLMSDSERLPQLTLPALQQLSLYQQHAVDVTNGLIQSYALRHPSASCVECQDEEPAVLLLPCRHSVLCDDCAKDAAHCPWTGCGQPVETTQRLVDKLPSTLTEQNSQ